MDYEEEKRLMKNWRGRRLMACRTIDTLQTIIDNLGVEEDPKVLPSVDSKAIVPNESQKREMKNLAAVLLRMILNHNDGGLSNQELRTW